MLSIQENISLVNSNTLALNVRARYYIEITDTLQIPAALAFAQDKQLNVLVLGGGSNVVLTKHFPGVVIKILLRGIAALEADETVTVTAAAGENWHHLVQYCLERGYNGLENLALIPGSVGAAPIQNIGAYGVELTQYFESLTGWDTEQQCWRTLNKKECDFGYRDSVFKRSLKERFVIVEVSLRLHLTTQVVNNYSALSHQLAQQNIKNPSPQQIAEAVIAVRQRKLPDPEQVANVGSFFKNPLVSKGCAEKLQQQYPQLVMYPQLNGMVKLAAGWLLEKAGWKGRRTGNVGIHGEQSLVLINYADASGAEVLGFAQQIQQDILQQFDISLDIEPSIY
ncbi:MAG: UDP-N-acetylmuramate dehydrogenase [Pseudomonadales bacterium]